MTTYLSPTLAELEKQLNGGYTSALETFWEEQQARGTPLIEPSADPESYLVTFVYKNDTPGNHILLLGCPANFDAIDNQLLRMDETNLWYLTFTFPADLRTTYGFFSNAPRLPSDYIDNPDFNILGEFFTEMQARLERDSMNHHTYTIPVDVWLNPNEIPLSLLELPKAPPQPLVKSRPGVPKGTVHNHVIQSPILDNKRDAWIYTPPVGHPENETMGLLVLFDGLSYTRLVSAPAILDNLIHEGLIPPTMAILIDNPDDETRDRELGCNSLMPQFFIKELIPWVKKKYGGNFEASKTVVAGSSFGGLGAFYFGLHSPQVFGNVLSMSGYLGWGHELDRPDMWIVDEYAKSTPLPQKIYFDVGTLETGPPTFDRKQSFVEFNRSMEAVLKEKCVPFRYVEYSGGHDYLCWQQSLVDGLIFLIGK